MPRGQKPAGLRKPERMSAKQEAFVAHYVRLKNGTKAVVAAGYQSRRPDAVAAQLLDPKVYPLVAAAVRRALDEQNRRVLLDADAVLRYVHTAMLFCPGDYFTPAGDGGWAATLDEYRALPPEFKCLIEDLAFEAGGEGDTRTARLRVRFVSKEAAMALAARHQLSEKARVVVHQLDWSGLLRGGPPDPDPVEERIRAIEALPDPEPAEGNS